MKIKITQDDIDKGEKRNCSRCPIALALKRNYPDSLIEVSGKGIYVGSTRYSVTESILMFIAGFDGGLPVYPFEVEVELR